MTGLERSSTGRSPAAARRWTTLAASLRLARIGCVDGQLAMLCDAVRDVVRVDPAAMPGSGAVTCTRVPDIRERHRWAAPGLLT